MRDARLILQDLIRIGLIYSAVEMLEYVASPFVPEFGGRQCLQIVVILGTIKFCDLRLPIAFLLKCFEQQFTNCNEQSGINKQPLL